MRLLQKYKITKVLLIATILIGVIGLANAGLVHAEDCTQVPAGDQQQCSDSLANAQSYCNGLSGDQQQACSDSISSCDAQQTPSDFLGCLNDLSNAVQTGQTCPSGQDLQYNGSVLSCATDQTQSGATGTSGVTPTGSGCVSPGVGSTGVSDEACSNTGDPALGGTSQCDISSCSLVDNYVKPFIVLLSILVGIVAVLSLILGGIQYTTSSGDPQKTAQAKSRIGKTIMALLAYAFLYAFLNFLIPGGVKF